ncbi:fascin domain-containing protein [Phreatobacter stygius]|uniref:Uncharacterized protein n=1 Tax=Phreatobacter stygius TaxID=1940610 RepID=A0A4D7BD94_9HYPH|nr:hypothetical protein [Phreatobacter stygius]QCI67958.1 hypothetical protein E8M01_29260 [Phreatobacter stygius]
MGTDFRRLSLNEALHQDPQFLANVERITGRRTMVTDLFNPGHLYERESPIVSSRLNGNGNGAQRIRPTNVQIVGGVWQISMSHRDVEEMRQDVRAFCTRYVPPFNIIMETMFSLISTVDAIGLNHGVNVAGIIATQFVTVTPAFFSPVEMLKGIKDKLQEVTGLPGGVVGAGLGAGITLLAVGPAGVVLGGLAGWLGDALLSDSPRPGDVHADRQVVGPWEKLLLVAANPNDPTSTDIAIGTRRGYFCAENGGGGPVYANRTAIGPWETATLVHNPNGTVSLRALGGHYLVAEQGGGDGSFCNWNRTAVGEWEQFWMEYQPDGCFALKTFARGTYVSVQ